MIQRDGSRKDIEMQLKGLGGAPPGGSGGVIVTTQVCRLAGNGRANSDDYRLAVTDAP